MAGSIGWLALIGGLVLGAVMLYALIGNRRRSAADERRTEEATRALHQQIDREDAASDPDPKRY